MKRIISLVLAVLLLVTITVPVVAADGELGVSVSVVPVTISTDGSITESSETITKNSIIMLKINFQNGTGAPRYVQNAQFYIKYDAEAVQPYTFEKNYIPCGPGIFLGGADVATKNVVDQKLVTITWATSGGVPVGPSSALMLAGFLFKVNENVESGKYSFEFDTSNEEYPNQFGVAEKFQGAATEFVVDYAAMKPDVSIVGDNPVLASTTVSSDTAEYASGAKLTLGAKSLSGKDITGLVAFVVTKQQENGTYAEATGFTINGSELTVDTTNPAAVGTYKVDVNLTNDNDKVRIPGTYTCAEFTIIPAKITNPAVAITGFTKGAGSSSVSYSFTPAALTQTGSAAWYEGSPIDGKSFTGKFAASTAYSVSLDFTVDSNYVLEPANGKISVTIDGVAKQPVSVDKSGEGKYTIVVSDTTADAEKPTITNMAAIDAVYGDKLSAHTTELNGTVTNAADDPVTGKFTWADNADETTVDTVGSREFIVNFTPDDLFNYAPTTAKVIVNVAKKQIEFNRADYGWKVLGEEDPTESSSTFNFAYDGKEHGIEAYCKNADIKNFVTFEYDSQYANKGIRSANYTVFATVKLTDTENCEFKGAPENTKIQNGGFSIQPVTVDGSGEYSTDVRACYTVTEQSVALSELGIPADVLADTNNRYGLRQGIYTDDNKVLNGEVTLENGVLKFNLASGLDKSAIDKTATIKVGLFISNYTTNHQGITGINNGEKGLFILTLNVTIIEKESNKNDKLKVTVDDTAYGETVTPKFSSQPDNVTNWKYVYTKSDNAAGPFNETTINTAPAGEYTLTVTCEDNTTIYEATADFTITPRDISKKDVATVTFDPQLTYNGKDQTQTMTVEVGTTKLELGKDYELNTTDGAALTQKDAGSYTVIIKGKGNYTGTLLAAFTIAKATPAATDFTFTAPENLVYDGNPKTATVTPKEGIGYVTVYYNDSTTAPTDVGTYAVTIRAEESANYKARTVVNNDWTFTINPKTVTVEEVKAQQKIYDGNTNATLTGNLVGVLKKDEANVTLNPPSASFADANVAWSTGAGATEPEAKRVTVAEDSGFTLKGSAARNYQITTQPDFTKLQAKITPATITVNPVVLTANVRYDATGKQPVSLPTVTGLVGSDNLVNCTVRQSTVGSYRYELLKAAPSYNAESGKIEFELAGTTEAEATLPYVVELDYGGNYEPHPYSLELKIRISIRAAQSTLTYTGATSVDYDKTLTLSYAGGSGMGNVWYTVEDSMMAEVNGSILTPKAAGNIFITVHKDGDSDYLPATSQKVQVTINKATPPTPPEIKVDNTDTTLGELGNKMLVRIGVPGTIHWYGPDGKPITEPDNTKIEANTEYSWEFIPADGYKNNYTPIYGKTTPYVRDDLSWLPGVLGGGSTFNFRDVTRYDYFYSAVKWAAENGIASGTSRYTFSPDAVCTRAQTVTFLWRAAGSPMPSYRISPFTDVNYGDYYYNAVLWAVEQGITTGLTATTFGPDKTVTRGQVAMFLYRAASAVKPNITNSFTDVKSTAYNYDAILWAYDNRITTGTSTTTFSPDAFCTRAQIVTFLYRFYQGR